MTQIPIDTYRLQTLACCTIPLTKCCLVTACQRMKGASPVYARSHATPAPASVARPPDRLDQQGHTQLLLEPAPLEPLRFISFTQQILQHSLNAADTLGHTPAPVVESYTQSACSYPTSGNATLAFRQCVAVATRQTAPPHNPTGAGAAPGCTQVRATGAAACQFAWLQAPPRARASSVTDGQFTATYAVHGHMAGLRLQARTTPNHSKSAPSLSGLGSDGFFVLCVDHMRQLLKQEADFVTATCFWTQMTAQAMTVLYATQVRFAANSWDAPTAESPVRHGAFAWQPRVWELSAGALAIHQTVSQRSAVPATSLVSIPSKLLHC